MKAREKDSGMASDDTVDHEVECLDSFKNKPSDVLDGRALLH